MGFVFTRLTLGGYILTVSYSTVSFFGFVFDGFMFSFFGFIFSRFLCTQYLYHTPQVCMISARTTHDFFCLFPFLNVFFFAGGGDELLQVYETGPRGVPHLGRVLQHGGVRPLVRVVRVSARFRGACVRTVRGPVATVAEGWSWRWGYGRVGGVGGGAIGAAGFTRGLSRSPAVVTASSVYSRGRVLVSCCGGP